VAERLLRSRLHREIVMSDTGPVFNHTLQREIDDLREQAMLLPPGRKRNRVLARADALEVTMKAFSWAASPALQPPRRDSN
jgi:hypothetical protein